MRPLGFVFVAPIALWMMWMMSMMSMTSTVLSAQTPASTQPPAQQKPAAPPPAAAPQTPPPQSTQPPGEKPAPPPPPLETYTYQPQGRRDPFLNLLGTGTEPRTGTGKRADGPAAMATAEISVRGILQSRGALVAMITGPDGKTYVVHQGDKLLDGTIKTITPQGLIVIQEVNDPLSLVKQREVTKLLRALEVAKE